MHSLYILVLSFYSLWKFPHSCTAFWKHSDRGVASGKVKSGQENDEQASTPGDMIRGFLVPLLSQPSSVIREDPAEKSREKSFLSMSYEAVASNTRDSDSWCLGWSSGFYVF